MKNEVISSNSESVANQINSYANKMDNFALLIREKDGLIASLS
jgi:hypothetical protein